MTWNGKAPAHIPVRHLPWPILIGLARLVFCLSLCLLAWRGTGRAAPTARFIDYLYVEANEGDSSGGHAALRFDRHTFHFQHEPPGIIRIQRIDASAFDYLYSRLGNRTIRENRIEVSDETYDLLQNALLDLLMIQDARMAVRDDLRRNVRFFEMLLATRRSGDRPAPGIRLPIRGAGYLLPDSPLHAGDATGEQGTAPPSPCLTALRERIKAVHGEHFIEERIARIEVQLREAPLHADGPPSPETSGNTLPRRHPTAVVHHENALLALFALKTLLTAPPLHPGTFWTSDAEPFRLNPAEKPALRAFANRQEQRLVRLVNSGRSDWGFPFLLGMARLSAVNASLSSGRLVFPDIFPAMGEKRSSRDDSAGRFESLPPDYLPVMARERWELFRLRREEFFRDGASSESGYSILERAGNLLLDIERAVATGGQPHKLPDSAFPSREALRSDVILPDMDEATLLRELESARRAVENYSEELARLYAYHLTRRNCVTELFSVINRALGCRALDRETFSGSSGAGLEEIARKESNERLGGFIDPSRGLNFVPFVSADEVAARYRVVSSRERLSYRRQRLEEMKRSESSLAVFLRESNTLTSTVYRFTPGDSLFLFFTDDTFLLRPLFGAFNLLAGAGQTLFGVAALPVQGPSPFVSGARGVIFSLPELVFVNIRKGSLEWMQ